MVEEGNDSYHCMVAKDLLRRNQISAGHRCVMLIIQLMEFEIPSIVYLDDFWSKSILDSDVVAPEEGAAYVDEDGKAFASDKVDALRAAHRVARRRAGGLHQPLWSQYVINETAEEIMAVIVKT